MDHQKTAAAAAKPKNKILKFLPRATSSVSFQNPPLYSPAKDKRSSEKTHKSNLGIGFSGPMVSMIPADTRRKIKNDTSYTVVFEPTSPKVSCMGQVKCRHQKKILSGNTQPIAGKANKQHTATAGKPNKKVARATSFQAVRGYNSDNEEVQVEKTQPAAEVKSKKKLGLRSIFGGAGGRKSDATSNYSKPPLYLDKAPSLSQMKRFASGRDAFSNFDWTTQVTPVESDRRSYDSDEEEEEVMIPFSAPIVMRTKGVDEKFTRSGGVCLEPRKEINLWKRRTMPQPKPLQLHT